MWYLYVYGLVFDLSIFYKAHIISLCPSHTHVPSKRVGPSFNSLSFTHHTTRTHHTHVVICFNCAKSLTRDDWNFMTCQKFIRMSDGRLGAVGWAMIAPDCTPHDKRRRNLLKWVARLKNRAQIVQCMPSFSVRKGICGVRARGLFCVITFFFSPGTQTVFRCPKEIYI